MRARSLARTQAVEELARRLEALPRAELAACIERAEALIDGVEPDGLYGEAELLARLVGRAVAVEDPGTIVGRALLTDLSALVERLSEAAGQTPADLGEGAVTARDLAARWGVSGATLGRYRRQGLVARRVRVGDRTAVMFSAGAVARFERRRGALLERAGRFERMGEGERARVVAQARRYHDRFGWSLNRVAVRIAARRGRSVEGVRRVLQRHEATAREPIFGEAGPPGERERAVVARVLRRGVEPAWVAQRTGRSVASVRRAATEHRAALLRGLDLSGPVLKTFGRGEAREVLLGSVPVRSGLGRGGEESLGALLEGARVRRAPVGAEESARAVAVHFLRFAAARGIAGLDRTTAEPGAVDRIETDLRWASLLKAELVRPHLALIVETLEGAAGVRLEGVPARELAWVLGRAIGAASAALDRFDPGHAGRTAAPIALAVGRVAGEWAQRRGAGRVRDGGEGRASRRLDAGAVARDWTLGLDAWQRWLAPDPRVVRHAGGLDERGRVVLACRYGLPVAEGAAAPMTLGETAERMGTSVVHAARFEREAVRGALAAARGERGGRG